LQQHDSQDGEEEPDDGTSLVENDNEAAKRQLKLAPSGHSEQAQTDNGSHQMSVEQNYLSGNHRAPPV